MHDVPYKDLHIPVTLAASISRGASESASSQTTGMFLHVPITDNDCLNFSACKCKCCNIIRGTMSYSYHTLGSFTITGDALTVMAFSVDTDTLIYDNAITQL